jgi:deoxyadenosine/deoxycytidine kinase
MGGRIEICGGIATGKTTLASLLAEHGDSALLLEDFRKNPFWERFYQRPDLFTHEKNVCFLAQHAGEIKSSTEAVLTICDYAVVQDLAYASLTRNPEHTSVMTTLYEHLYAALPPPTLIIHLRCNETIQLARIRARGRREEDPITVAYLASLNVALDDVLASRPPACPVRAIRSDAIDFAQDRQKALLLKRDLLASVRG